MIMTQVQIPDYLHREAKRIAAVQMTGSGLSFSRRYATRVISGHGNRGLEVHGYHHGTATRCQPAPTL
jgi:hypothetical protein